MLLVLLDVSEGQLLQGPIFASNSCWQAKLPNNAPISGNTSAYVANIIGQVNKYGPWINTLTYSVPIYVVPADQPTVYVKLNKPGGAPIIDDLQTAWSATPLPPDAHPANGTDHHLVILQPSTGKMWEFWLLVKEANSSGSFWSADWGGYLMNYHNSTGFFEQPFPTWGATATSLMLAGGLMLISEAKAGLIPHALAFATLDLAPWNEVVLPAQRSDGNGNGIIPEGTRFRLPPNVNLSGITNPYAKLMAEAIRDYGMLTRDTAGVPVTYAEDPTPYGIPNPWPSIFGDWENHIMNQLPWSEMQVVDPIWTPWDPKSTWYQPPK
jgi:hypothetical protein